MAQGSTLVQDGIRIVEGTPTAPLRGSTLFLSIWRVSKPGEPPRTRAALSMARPGPRGYVIKELIPDMELDAKAALGKAVAIAKRGEVPEIYLNADLTRLPLARAAG
ncbi:MAG TPA: hypothetical protein VIC71_00335 [Gammaproteobacteria bacterium]|jgi:hypothetical protein